MKWEVPLLLGFLLFFSTWISLPVTNNYYFDSNNIKHYILTPASSYQNDVDNLTNILFIKYENPWDAHSEIVIILFTGIFVLLLIPESSQLYLRYKILTSLKFNLLKYFGCTLNKSGNLNTTQKHYDEDDFVLTHTLNYSFFRTDKLKKSSKGFSLIFSLVLFSFYLVFFNAIIMTKTIIFSSAFSCLEIKIRNFVVKVLPLQGMMG